MGQYYDKHRRHHHDLEHYHDDNDDELVDHFDSHDHFDEEYYHVDAVEHPFEDDDVDDDYFWLSSQKNILQVNLENMVNTEMPTTMTPLNVFSGAQIANRSCYFCVEMMLPLMLPLALLMLVLGILIGSLLYCLNKRRRKELAATDPEKLYNEFEEEQPTVKEEPMKMPMKEPEVQEEKHEEKSQAKEEKNDIDQTTHMNKMNNLMQAAVSVVTTGRSTEDTLKEGLEKNSKHFITLGNEETFENFLKNAEANGITVKDKRKLSDLVVLTTEVPDMDDTKHTVKQYFYTNWNTNEKKFNDPLTYQSMIRVLTQNLYDDECVTKMSPPTYISLTSEHGNLCPVYLILAMGCLYNHLLKRHFDVEQHAERLAKQNSETFNNQMNEKTVTFARETFEKLEKLGYTDKAVNEFKNYYKSINGKIPLHQEELRSRVEELKAKNLLPNDSVVEVNAYLDDVKFIIQTNAIAETKGGIAQGGLVVCLSSELEPELTKCSKNAFIQSKLIVNDKEKPFVVLSKDWKDGQAPGSFSNALLGIVKAVNAIDNGAIFIYERYFSLKVDASSLFSFKKSGNGSNSLFFCALCILVQQIEIGNFVDIFNIVSKMNATGLSPLSAVNTYISSKSSFNLAFFKEHYKCLHDTINSYLTDKK